MNNVRNDNLMSVFYDICSHSPATRGDISQRTELSVVTVCKCVQNLRKLKLINEYNIPNYQLGRNAGYLETAKDSLFLVIDLSQRNYEYCLLNLHSKLIQRDFYYNNPVFMLEDNIRAFLNSIRVKMKNLNNYHIINIGVILPDADDECFINTNKRNNNCFNFIDIDKIIKESLCTEKFITEHFIFCAYQYLRDEYQIQPDSVYVYLSMMSDYPSVCVLNSLIPKLLSIGDIPISNTVNYSQVLKMTADLELLKKHTATALCSIVSITDPKVVFLIDDNYTFTSYDIAKIEKDVLGRIDSEIKIVQYKNDFALLGFAKLLTRSIFDI